MNLMKMTATKHLTCALAAVIGGGLIGAALFAAEEPQQATPRPAAGARPERAAAFGAPGERPPGRFGPGAGFTETQMTLIREAYQANREEFNKLNEKIRAAETALKEAVLAPKYDEKLVREKAETLSKLQTEQMCLRLKAFSAVVPTLTPEQRERMKTMPVGMMTGGLLGPGMGPQRPDARQPGGPGQRPPRREDQDPPPR